MPLTRRRFAGFLLLAGGGCAAPAAGDATLPERARNARFVLLGEVHDNAEQHRRRAALLAALLADGRPTRVVFEQMMRDRDAAIAAAPRDADAVATAGALDRRGWRWPLHEPILAAALAGGARVAGGNLEPQQVRAIVRGGAAAAPAELQPYLGSANWSGAQQQALEHEIDVGHCGALPPSQWAPMALGQRARDASMARALLDAAAAGERAVLIAGNAHVRSDFGVPHHLRAAGVAPGQIVAVAFVEEGDSAPAGVFDVERRTARAEREDPCAAFRR